MQSSIDIVERNVVTTNTWLTDIAAEKGDIDGELSWRCLRAAIR